MKYVEAAGLLALLCEVVGTWTVVRRVDEDVIADVTWLADDGLILVFCSNAPVVVRTAVGMLLLVVVGGDDAIRSSPRSHTIGYRSLQSSAFHVPSGSMTRQSFPTLTRLEPAGT